MMASNRIECPECRVRITSYGCNGQTTNYVVSPNASDEQPRLTRQTAFRYDEFGNPIRPPNYRGEMPRPLQLWNGGKSKKSRKSKKSKKSRKSRKSKKSKKSRK